jgi:hypothetical protein
MLCKHLPFGYVSNDDGLLEVDAEKGAYVKRIFKMAQEGVSQNRIATLLMEECIRTSTGKTNWNDSTVRFILMNKKYTGEENFPAIISKDMFEKVSQIRSERYMYYNLDRNKNIHSNKALYPFSGKIICGLCGSILTRVLKHSSKTNRKYGWKCSRYIENGKVYCRSSTLDELIVEAMFVEAFSDLKKHFDKYIKDLENPFRPAINGTIIRLDKEIQGMINQLENMPEGQSDSMIIEENIRRFLKQRTEEVWKAAVIDDFETKNIKLENELMKYKKAPQEFNGELFRKVVDHITLLKEDSLLFQFINGIVIEKDCGKTQTGGILKEAFKGVRPKPSCHNR